MTSNIYRARGDNQPGVTGRIHTLAAQIEFDGSPTMGDAVPGPAHLLAASLAACVLKNVERFGQMLPFAYSAAQVDVELERQDAPPRIIRASYELRVHTDEPAVRCALLHKNIRKFGTISNTLAQACALEPVMLALRTDGSVTRV
ncbi:hypothetical protein DB30_04412 [Enhygromyxa salina]|uniref:OsmC-like protein n=1 Tax=Enhygromyxa salina TaxID=215803 RepID=A0A0C1ZFQ7_9BACT|nr:OsmC family protein [Enhygromyxa salina]KIG16499.1 hypothetical protein DB30_04412 [Enhygromyxa salina]